MILNAHLHISQEMRTCIILDAIVTGIKLMELMHVPYCSLLAFRGEEFLPGGNSVKEKCMDFGKSLEARFPRSEHQKCKYDSDHVILHEPL